MENLITWLEKQIEGCDDLGGMEKEKWAFIQTLKKVRKEQLSIHVVSQQREPLIAYRTMIEFDVKHEDFEESVDYFLENKESYLLFTTYGGMDSAN